MGKHGRILLAIFIIAFLFRLLIFGSAYHGDLNNNISWGRLVVERGFEGFYEGENWPYSAPNQPPLTILMFGLLAFLWEKVEAVFWFLNTKVGIFPSKIVWFWESRGMTFLFKLPSIIADLAIGWMIYQYMLHKKRRFGVYLTLLWLFNPVVWYNSTVWGQTDSLVNFLGLASTLSLIRKKLILSFMLFSLSLTFKGSLLIFVPILLFVAVRQKYRLSVWIKAAVGSLFAVFFFGSWFHPRPDITQWLFNLYKGRILPGEIGYLTANAFNLWWLVDPGKIPDSNLYLGLPARVWGFVILLTGIILILVWLTRKVNDIRIFFSLIFLSFLSFLFMTRIHERYLYPFFPYATFFLASEPLFIFPYAVLSVTHLLNLYHLFWAPVGFLKPAFENQQFPNLLAIVNIFVFVFICLRYLAKKS